MTNLGFMLHLIILDWLTMEPRGTQGLATLSGRRIKPLTF